MTDLNNNIKQLTQEKLTRVYRKKINDKGEEEKPWFNEEIGRLIDRRKQYNRLRRNAKSKEEENKWAEKYNEYKILGKVKI